MPKHGVEEDTGKNCVLCVGICDCVRVGKDVGMLLVMMIGWFGDDVVAVEFILNNHTPHTTKDSQHHITSAVINYNLSVINT